MGTPATPIDTLPGQGQAPPAASPQVSSGAGLQVLTSLLDMNRKQNEAMQPLIKEALTPTASPAHTNPNAAVGVPVQAFQQNPYNNEHTTGAHATKAKGIANTITGLTNLVGQYEQKSAQEKQRVLAVDIERVMQAQDGITQAKQTLEQDPNNAQAQAAIKKNTDIVNAMLSDPKRRKSIAKALDINFVDPSQNTNPEHGALNEASKSYAAQLQANTPTQQGPNVAAQQRLALAQAQQEATNKTIQTIVPVLLKEEGANARNQNTVAGRQTDAEIAAKAHLQATKIASDSAYNRVVTAAKITGNSRLIAVTQQQHGAWDRVQSQISGRMAYLKQKDSDIATQTKVITGNTTMLNNYMKTIQADQKQLDLLHVNKKIDDGTYQAKHAYNEGQLKQAQDQIQAGQQYLNNVATQQMGASVNGQPTTTQSSSGQQATASTGSGSTYELPKVGAESDTDENTEDPDYYDPLAN